MIITDSQKLKNYCREVSLFEAFDIVAKLEKELVASKSGIGLSANQIGIDAQVCIIRAGKTHLNLANPKIIEQDDLCIFENEGCLSFPSKFITTKRYKEILVKDLFQPTGVALYGFEAVVAQHEISHCFGQTMYDFEVKLNGGDRCFCNSGKKYKLCHKNKIIK